MELMRTLYIMAIAMLLVGCGEKSAVERRRLLVDMNSTMGQMLTLRDCVDGAVVDSALADENGVYLFDIDSVADGFYDLWVDTVKILDVVLCESKTVEICACVGFEINATTNSEATMIQWELNRWRREFEERVDTIVSRYDVSRQGAVRDTARMLISKELKRLRVQSDSMLVRSDGLLTTIPILLSSYNGQRLYSLSSDLELFESQVRRLEECYPSVGLVTQMKHQVDSLMKSVLFARRYKAGSILPPLSIVKKDGSKVDIPMEERRPYVVYIATDTTAQAERLWARLEELKPQVLKLYASVPEKYKQKKFYNIERGEVVNIDREVLEQLQPMVVVVEPNGEIKKAVFNVRMSDVNNVWQKLTIFATTNNHKSENNKQPI